MFPMIISIEEVVDAYAVLEECKDELHKEGIPFQEEIEAGVMTVSYTHLFLYMGSWHAR